MNRLLFSLKTCQKSGAHFSEKKKRLRQRAQKLRASKNMGAIFLGKKSACGNVPRSSGLPKKSGTIFQKYFVQKPAKPATDLSHNGHQKIHLVQKPFRLLFPATISLKSFWTGYFRPFRPFRPGMFTTLQNQTPRWQKSSHTCKTYQNKVQKRHQHSVMTPNRINRPPLDHQGKLVNKSAQFAFFWTVKKSV